jgi:hypothetical protein
MASYQAIRRRTFDGDRRVPAPALRIVPVRQSVPNGLRSGRLDLRGNTPLGSGGSHFFSHPSATSLGPPDPQPVG